MKQKMETYLRPNLWQQGERAADGMGEWSEAPRLDFGLWGRDFQESMVVQGRLGGQGCLWFLQLG